MSSERITDVICETDYPRLYALLNKENPPFDGSIFDRYLADFFNQDEPKKTSVECLKPLYEYMPLSLREICIIDALSPLEIAILLDQPHHFKLLLTQLGPDTK